MMIVLGFVVIGIATTLQIRAYEAKQLLAKLIGVDSFSQFLTIDMRNIYRRNEYNDEFLE